MGRTASSPTAPSIPVSTSLNLSRLNTRFSNNPSSCFRLINALLTIVTCFLTLYDRIDSCSVAMRDSSEVICRERRARVVRREIIPVSVEVINRGVLV